MVVKALPGEGNNEELIRARWKRQSHKWKDIYEAAQNGDLNAIKHFVEDEHVDVNKSKLGNSGTPLMIAAIGGYLNVVEYLISQGADVNAKDKFGYSALLWALDGNQADLELIKYLVEQGADVNIKAKENGYSPLHWAAHNNRLDALTFLIESRANINSQARNGDTPFFVAASKGNLEIINYCLKKKIVQYDGDIFAAARKGYLGLVKYFIDVRLVEPFVKNKNGNTALHEAAAHGNLNIVKYFIEEKTGNVDLTNQRGETPLISACAKGHLEVVKYLTSEKFADPNMADRNGYNSLLIAVKNGHLSVTRYLLDHGNADVTAKDKDQNSALHIAAENGSLALVKFLVEKKHIDPYIKNKYGQNPLFVAKANDKNDIVRYFVNVKGMPEPTVAESSPEKNNKSTTSKNTKKRPAEALITSENSQVAVDEDSYEENTSTAKTGSVNHRYVNKNGVTVESYGDENNGFVKYTVNENPVSYSSGSGSGNRQVVMYRVSQNSPGQFVQGSSDNGSPGGGGNFFKYSVNSGPSSFGVGGGGGGGGFNQVYDDGGSNYMSYSSSGPIGGGHIGGGHIGGGHIGPVGGGSIGGGPIGSSGGWQSGYSYSYRKKRNIADVDENIDRNDSPIMNTRYNIPIPWLRKNISGFLPSTDKQTSDSSVQVQNNFSTVDGLLALLNLGMRQMTGNSYQQPVHESLLSPTEIIERKIDTNAINAVNDVYSFEHLQEDD